MTLTEKLQSIGPGETPEGELHGGIGIGRNEAGAQDGVAARRGVGKTQQTLRCPRHLPFDPLHSTRPDLAQPRRLEDARTLSELRTNGGPFPLVDPWPADRLAALGAFDPRPHYTSVDPLDVP